MVPFTKIVFKTFPNKWKRKDTHPDTKGTVECALPDGTVVVYDYAQWKPREGKSQTMTIWTLKQDKPQEGEGAAGGGDQDNTGTDHQPESAPVAQKPAATPTAPRIKDDADGW